MLGLAVVLLQPKNRPNMAEVVRALAEAKALLSSGDSGAVESSEAALGPDGEDSLECSLDLTPIPGSSLVSGHGGEDKHGSFSISVVPVDEK